MELDPADVESPAPRRCILHISGKPAEKKPRSDILPFDEKNWSSVQSAAANRRAKPQFTKSVYYDLVVNLPSNPDTNDGYHVACYQKFTAIPSSVAPVGAPVSSDTTERSSLHLRSDSSTRNDDAEPSSSGLFPATCLFCNSKRKKKKGGNIELLGSCETLEAGQSIQNAAELLQDDEILSKITGIDLIAKEAKYHHTCKSAYLLSARRTATREDGRQSTILASTADKDTDDNQQKKTIPLSEIHDYVEKSVIANKRPELLTSIYERYLDFCSAADESPMHRFSLMRNLTNRFESTIKVHTPSGKKLGCILYNAEIADDSVRVAYDYSESEERILNRAALILRKKLLNAPKKDVPEIPNLNDVRDGDTDVPQPITNFFKVLYTGNISDQCGKRIKRRIDSTSQDVLFVVQKGRAKPSKHVTLGMAIRSITGSKKLVQVLNRLGHCLNYSSLEELETATAEAIRERKQACPENTLPGFPMGLAFDNFDELTQTLSGSNTLHDTMGILYQNLPKDCTATDDQHSNVPEDCNTTSLQSPNISSKTAAVVRKAAPGTKKPVKKRSLTVSETSLPPYFGVPKVRVFEYKNTSVFSLPDVGIHARHLDLVWMMSHVFETDLVLPMWVGFNANFHKDELPKQEVRYMPNLKEPITSLSVVRRTLQVTKKCAEECNQVYGLVTYDLNAAKPAMQIQVRESPTFDNVFIMMGAFHIEMAFFKAVGKLLAESGGPDMLTGTGVLAPGSLNGFLTGKHFNRCKRLHPLLALAFESLHFKSFLKTYGLKEEVHDVVSAVQGTTATGRDSDIDEVISSDIFKLCATEYSEYTQATLSGAHGYTAQFWMMYVEYIKVYHQLERAIRTNDVDLFVFTLTPLIDLFFATGHINYSRWLTKYQLDLLNIDDSHPGLKDILNHGAFTVRRTEHNFSRIPVDLTLEQTINADAASRLTGITSFTNDYAARLRWMTTKAVRASFISLLQEMTGLVSTEDVTAELRPTRIQRDHDDLQKIIKQILETNNPFETTEGDILYNISTGKGTSDEIRQSLLNVPTKGKARHKEFIESCQNDPQKFESPIKKEKLKTFQDGCATNRRTKDKKIAALKGSRDLMGRLLVLATKKSLDLQYVLQFPLVPVPLSMATTDEIMAKTDKSTLLDILVKKVNDIDEKPENISAFIIDGQFLLHSLPPNLPSTYGGLARSVLNQSLTSSAQRVHIVFDDYPQPSIKDTERDRRGTDNRTFIITGPEQRRVPRDLNDALKSRSFKKQLPQFLAKEWQDPSYADMIESHDLFLDVPGECYHFQVKDGVIHRETVHELRSNHEEADTKICLHSLAADSENGNIVVRASDTDIAVILLYHCSRFQGKLWMDTGTALNNNRRYINLTSICAELGPDLCAALPAFHAFTGSDYTSAFVRKGKVRPFKILEKNTYFQDSFKVMVTEATLSEETKGDLHKFTATIYGAKDSADTRLNEFRYQKFVKAYGPKQNGKNKLSSLKGLDASGLPPCEDVVNAHIKRAFFVANMWANAHKTDIEQHPTEVNGWQLEDGHYKPIWFDGLQVPESLIPEENDMEVLGQDDEDDMGIASSDEDNYSSDDDD